MQPHYTRRTDGAVYKTIFSELSDENASYVELRDNLKQIFGHGLKVEAVIEKLSMLNWLEGEQPSIDSASSPKATHRLDLYLGTNQPGQTERENNGLQSIFSVGQFGCRQNPHKAMAIHALMFRDPRLTFELRLAALQKL